MSKLDLFHYEIVDDYLNNGLSMRALESKYGVNRKFIRAHMDAHNIPRKKHGFIAPHIQEKLDDPEWMETTYLETRSIASMGKILGVTKNCVSKYMKKHGISLKGNKFYYGEGDKKDVKIEDVQYESTFTYESSISVKHAPTHPKLKNKEWVLETYKSLMSIAALAELTGVSYPTAQNALHYHNIPIAKHGNTSLSETLLINRTRDLNPVQSYNLDGIELDVYFPEHKVAVEIHGLRYHSELSGGKGRSYHQNKYEVCRQHGIHLYQFWDHEVNGNTDLIIDMIRAKCGQFTPINARECEVSVNDKVEDFLDANHIQGKANYTTSLTLKYKGSPVAVMTFIRCRNKQYDWELNRFSVKRGHSVRGGFTKLLKRAPEGTIVSYSDCRYSDGGVYRKTGFIHTRTNDPIYYYTSNYKTLEGRMGYQKSRIKDKFPDQYNPTKTEWQNMQQLGFDRVWGCKTYTWVMKKENPG